MKDELLFGLFPIVVGFVGLLIVAGLIFGATHLLDAAVLLLGEVLP